MKNNKSFIIRAFAILSVVTLGALSIATLVKVNESTNNGEVGDLKTSSPGGESKAGDYQLQLLHYSDIDGGRNIVDYVQRFAAITKKFKQEYDNTLVLGTGDLWIAGPEYNAVADGDNQDFVDFFGSSPKPGRAHISWANEIGVAASTFGNHEFDQRPGAIADIIKPAKGGWSGAAFPYVVTNLDFSQNADLGPLIVPGGQDVTTIKGKITDYATVTIGGEKIGLVGAVYPDLDKITSLDNVTLIDANYDTFDEKLEHVAMQVQEDVDRLKATGINKIILMTHMQQFQNDRKLAPMLEGVDIIIGGGSNTILVDETDGLRTTDTGDYDSYPVMTHGKTNEPMMLVNVDGDFTYVGRLVVKFDKDGVLMPNYYDPVVSGAYSTTPATMRRLGLTEDDVPFAVRDVATIVKNDLRRKRGNVFGYTNVYLNGERSFVRTEETNLGNMIVDSKVAYAQQFMPNDVLIGIQNGGGIRGPIGLCVAPPGALVATDLDCNPPQADSSLGISRGAVSELDIQTTLKFNNKITVLTVTGSELKEIFEDGLKSVFEGATAGPFPQISNLKLEYYIDGTPVERDADGVITTPGEKVKTLTIIDNDLTTPGNQSKTIVENGQLVSGVDTESFKLVAPSWLSAINKSHDGYWSLGNVPEDRRQDLEDMTSPSGYQPVLGNQGEEQEALAWYLRTKYGSSSSAYDAQDDKRVTQGYTGTTPTDTRIVKLMMNS